MPSLPLPFIPSLAHRYGTENAVMLAVLIELVGGYKGQAQVSSQRLYGRLDYMSQTHQIALLEDLVARNLVELLPHTSGYIYIHLAIPQSLPQVDEYKQTGQYGEITPTPIKVNQYNLTSSLSPSGRRRQRDDELARIFAAKEYANANKVTMTAEWQPSANVLKMLQQNMQINETFARGLIDEFIVYSMEQGRKELTSAWDQKFLKYVKREHVQRYVGKGSRKQTLESYSQNEENKFVIKEKRRQLTAKVLDIGNTDW